MTAIDELAHLLRVKPRDTLDLRNELAQHNEAELVVFLDGLTEQGA